MSSCNYASFADNLLDGFTTDAAMPPLLLTKRFHQTYLTYTTVTANTVSTAPSTSTSTLGQNTSFPSTIDLDSIYEKLSQQFSNNFGPRLDISALEQQVTTTSAEIHNIKSNLELKLNEVTTSVQTLTEKVDVQYQGLTATVNNLTTTIERQNAVIARIQHDFKTSMGLLNQSLNKPLAFSPHITPTAAASILRHNNPAG